MTDSSSGFGGRAWDVCLRRHHRRSNGNNLFTDSGSRNGPSAVTALTAALIADAREAAIEVLTLDARGDNTNALHLYRSLGFTEYGRLPGFVAVGERRYDKVFYMLDFRLQG
ncbi:hypothetical protein [Micromonospora sp. NPDC002717]|uniref:GNAT family N-acetyltransferase n=1 Tax=Micromonospora sp. NPDC002717 TaxID=3154424 RepID=UPI0033294293